MNLCLTSSETSNLCPLDCFYELLNAKVIDLVPTDPQYLLIKTMIENTHAHNEYKLEIVDIFAVSRKSENLRFLPFKKLPNKSSS